MREYNLEDPYNLTSEDEILVIIIFSESVI